MKIKKFFEKLYWKFYKHLVFILYPPYKQGKENRNREILKRYEEK